jgi:hypothetical protein
LRALRPLGHLCAFRDFGWNFRRKSSSAPSSTYHLLTLGFVAFVMNVEVVLFPLNPDPFWIDDFVLTLACHHEATVSAFHRFDVASGPETHNHIYNIETMTAEQTQQPPLHQHEFALRFGHIHFPRYGDIQYGTLRHSTLGRFTLALCLFCRL